MKKILITGGCGYVGSFICLKFLKKKFEIFVVDNNKKGNVFINHKNIKYFKFNFGNRKKIIELINKNNIENFIHLAAYIDSAESVKKKNLYMKNNFYLTKEVFSELPKTSIKRIFFASTAAVYSGKNNKRISEKSKKIPESPYGKSKLMSEKFIIKKFDKSNINYVILRLFNVAGANPQILLGPYNSNYNHIFNKLIRNKKFKIYGNNYKTPDGSAVRDYVHPDDVAQAFFKSYNFLIKNRKNEIFNCGSGKPFSVKKVVDNFVKFSRNKIKISVGKRRPGDPAYTLSNNNKIKRKLKIKFKKSNLKNIISDLVLWKSSLSKKLGQKSKMISIKYKSNL